MERCLTRYLSGRQRSDRLRERNPQRTVHVQSDGAGNCRGRTFRVSLRRFAVTLIGSEAARLTERHLVDEAEVALHHLGPDQLCGRVQGDPVEAVGPRRVTEESWVIGGRSLKQEAFNIRFCGVAPI